MNDMVLKNTSGISCASNLTTFVIVYGASGYQNDAETSAWSRVFEIVNNAAKFATDLDVCNRQIKNLHDGNEDNDAVNVKQLNEMETKLINFFS